MKINGFEYVPRTVVVSRNDVLQAIEEDELIDPYNLVVIAFKKWKEQVTGYQDAEIDRGFWKVEILEGQNSLSWYETKKLKEVSVEEAGRYITFEELIKNLR